MAITKAASERTTAATPESVESIERALAPLVEHEQRLEREHREAWAMCGDADTYTIDPVVHVTEEERLLARDRLAAIPRELRLLRARLAPIRRQLEAARVVEREHRRETMFTGRKHEAVATLHALLVEAAKANAQLTAIEDAEHTACGSAVRFNWMELQPETPMTASRLASWIRHAREHGML